MRARLNHCDHTIDNFQAPLQAIWKLLDSRTVPLDNSFILAKGSLSNESLYLQMKLLFR